VPIPIKVAPACSLLLQWSFVNSRVTHPFLMVIFFRSPLISRVFMAMDSHQQARHYVAIELLCD
jgi:hypothetical protein